MWLYYLAGVKVCYALGRRENIDDGTEPLLLPGPGSAARRVSVKLNNDASLLLLLVDGAAMVPAFLDARCAAAFVRAEGILTEALSDGSWTDVATAGADDDDGIVDAIVVLGRLFLSLLLIRGLNERVGTTAADVGAEVDAAGLDDRLLKVVLGGRVAVKLNG